MSPSAGPDADKARNQYNRFATSYDRQLGLLRRIQQPLRRDAVESLRLTPGMTVLDVGCGTGASFAHLIAAVGPGGRIVGVDVSDQMLGLAQQRARDAGWRNVELIHTPAQDATLPQADAALMFFTHDLLRTPAALDTVVAAVRPGGRVVTAGARQPGLPMVAIALPVLLVMRRLYVTTGDGLREPWSLLTSRLDKPVVDLRVGGLCYLTSGMRPSSGQSPKKELH